ncbi:MAG: ATP-binding protein [Myxococcota bacterium]|nr:ATP-binding protein [Myxococcota bacterium]
MLATGSGSVAELLRPGSHVSRRLGQLAFFVPTILLCEYFVIVGSKPGTFGYWYVALLFPLLPAVAGIRALRTATRSESRVRIAWVAIFVGCFLMAITEGIWGYLELSPQGDSPLTSFTSVGYSLSPVFLLLGLLIYQDRSAIPGVALVLLSNLFIVFSAVVFVYLLAVYPKLPNAIAEPAVAILKALEGGVVMASTATAFAMVIYRQAGQKRSIMRLIFLGMVCVVAEYFTFVGNFMAGHGVFSSAFSVLYLVAAALWYVAASEQEYADAIPERETGEGWREERSKQLETLIPATAVGCVFFAAIVYQEAIVGPVLPYLGTAIFLLVFTLATRDWWAQRVEILLNNRLRDQATFLVQARDAAEASDAAKSRFLSWVSHETRTPLSGILGFAELLTEREFGELNSDQKEFVQSIRESGHHLLDLINDLLDVTKITMGAVELSLEDIDPSETVREVIQNINSGAVKEIAIVNQIKEGVPKVRVDARRFRQSLYNLLSNAVKFTPAGGSVGVRWKREGKEQFSLEVWDQGIGIAKDDLEKIFEDFYQVDKKRDEALGGSGIGLALTRRLANLHGGDVRVESRLGFGSRFFLTVPLAEVTEGEVSAGTPVEVDLEPAPRLSAEAATRVLVVDDAPSNLSVVAGLLRVRDTDSVLVQSAGEAIDYMVREHPELILMDIHMPDCDGFQALARIRADDRISNAYVVAMTASASESDQARYVKAGFDGFLAKPIDSAGLDTHLEEAASRLYEANRKA